MGSDVYYITREIIRNLSSSRGFEELYMMDPVDELTVQQLA